MNTALDSVAPDFSPDAIATAAHRVLEARTLADGPFGRSALEHRGTGTGDAGLTTANDTALTLLADGHALVAVSRFTDLVESCAAALGTDHPDTLVVRGNLVAARLAAGQAQRAVDDAQGVLDDRERVLGPQHPSTVNAGLALGMAHLAAGDTVAACAVLDTAMAVIERLRHGEHRRHRGDDHPLLRFCRSLLADARAAAPA